jgi:hypothetical protein
MTPKMENRVLARNGARTLSDEELELVSGGEHITSFLTRTPEGFADFAENVD